VHLYLRNNYPIPEALSIFPGLKLFQPKARSLRVGFHAKLISIEYSNKEIVFIGSANFSRQGFFLNLAGGANNECGIIISSNEKNIVSDWFKEGWDKPITLSDWEVNTNLLNLFT